MNTTSIFASAILFCLTVLTSVAGTINTNAVSWRFWRGTGFYADTQSFVIPLDFQKGIPLPDLGNCSELYGGTAPWFSSTARHSQTNQHFDHDYTSQQNDGSVYYFPIQNPIVAFGSAVGGSPLYTNETYRFGVHFGAQYESTYPEDAIYASPIRILVYQRSAFLSGTNNVSAIATNLISIPRRTVAADASAWIAFVTNNLTKVQESYGLRTEVRLVNGPTYDDAWGAQVFVDTMMNNVFQFSHTALPDSTNYYYQVEGLGDWVGEYSYPMVYNYDSSLIGWNPLYAISFDTRPRSRVRFLDQPHFRGEPLPPEYIGKSTDEWENYTGTFTNLLSLSNSANYTSLDNSPELRRHPILDKFVVDLRNDPIALASYVVNEIAVTDPMGMGDESRFPMDSVNLGGVNRGALGTFLEKQGSPVEQCALLVYLLRQAGYPAAYVWPTNNNLKLLDTTLSKLIRMQVRGAVDTYGYPFTSKVLITVNYPWVATRMPDGTTVHLFPWLKDTEVIEGLNLTAYLPTNYNHAYKWVADYVCGNTNILNLSTETDAPLDLFKKFTTAYLLTNNPTLSLDSFGVRYRDRQTRHSRWSDFAKPNRIDNQTRLAIVQDLTRITNVYTSWTNIFDTLQVQVQRGSSTIIDTGFMRTADIHTRKFLLYTNNNNLTMWMASYRTNITGQSSFSNDPGLTNKQVASAALQAGDTGFNVRFIHKRHQQLNPTNAVAFLLVQEGLGVTYDRPFYCGETAAIMFSAGDVTKEMIRLHAEDFWRTERRKQTNSAYLPTVDEYQGIAATIMGLSYFEQSTRSRHDLEGLYKVRNFSVVNLGLSKFAQATVTNTSKTLPIVDMQGMVVTVVGNSSLHPDSGDDLRNVFEDMTWHYIAQGSALEHRVINGFFEETNAVSTVKLLQIAQAKAKAGTSGVVQLYKMNYEAMGNSPSAGYGSTKLKDYDPSMWTAIVNTFTNWDGDYARVFITPAPQTNQGASYRGMAALVISKDNSMALIEPNLNGGWGSYEPYFGASGSFNYVDYSLGIGPNDTMFFDYNRGSGARSFDSVSIYDIANFFNGNSTLYATPFQQDATWQIGKQYGNTSPTFSGSFFTADNSGYFGQPDWLLTLGNQVADPVNPVTGEFYVDSVDLTLAGPFPLQMRRNYLSHNYGDNQFGVGWKWALTPYILLTNSAQGAINNLIYATEMDGSVVAYRRGTSDVWKPLVTDNPSLNNNNTYGMGSTANMLNARIERVITNNIDIYNLYGPDGSVRRYELSNYSISSGANVLDRRRPYLVEWRDHATNTLSFIYGQDNTAVDYGQVVRIASTNGNYLGFIYDSYGRIVEAYAGDGRRLFYEYDRYGDLVTVTMPDATDVYYEYGRYSYTNNGVFLDSNHLITREIKPDGRELANQYDSQRRVTNQFATVGTDLNMVRTVSFIYSNNYNLTNSVPLSGYTLILDVFGRTNRYDYTNGCVTKITDTLNQTIEQQWYSDTAVAPGYPRSLKMRKDKRGLWSEFKYDSQGNVTNMAHFSTPGMDNLTGDDANDATTTNAVWTALYNTNNNLLLETTDPTGNTVRFTYDTAFTWLPAQIVKLAQGVPISTNILSYYNVTDTVTNGSLMIQRSARGLRKLEVRGSVATNTWAHDGRGFVTQATRYAKIAGDTLDSDPPVITTLYYNDRGELIQKMDTDGRTVNYDYDGLGRPIWTEVYDEYGAALSRVYSYYNYNGDLVWTEGPQTSPDNYIWRDYDGAGRKTVEIAWCSEVNPDKTDVQESKDDNLYATSFYNYDSLGNLIKTIDPLGNYSIRRYDAMGQMIQQEWYDVSNHAFSTNYATYESGGLVRFTTNALSAWAETRYTALGKPRYRINTDGSVQRWKYYLDGRLKCEYLANNCYWTNVYFDSQRMITRYFKKSDGTTLASNVTSFDTRGNIVKTIDNEGKVWLTTLDGLDRTKTVSGPEIVTVTENCGQMIGCGVFVTNVAQRITTYTYDASGQVTTVSNSLGETTVTYLDGLGRTYRMDIKDSAGNYVHTKDITYYSYGHAVDYWEGTGSTALSRRDYFDHAGHVVLSYRWPNSGSDEYTRLIQKYDKAGNRTDTEESGRYYSGGSSYQEQVFATNHWTYDGLNRVITESVRDGAITVNSYDANNSITNRLLPGGLQQISSFTTDGRIAHQYVIGSGSDRMNEKTFSYYGSGSAFAGKLYTVTDGRGVVSTNDYDDWLRLKTANTGGGTTEQTSTTAYTYDRRGLLTQMSQSYASNPNNPGTTIVRSYDSYGFLSSEAVRIGDTNVYSVSLSYDLAGRRTVLAFFALPTINFGSRADGLLTSVSASGYTASYTYKDNGLLASRSDGTKSVYYNRDTMGRLLNSTNIFGTSTKLTETLIWWPDTRLSSYIAGRNDYTDTRNYDYAPWSRYLINEQYYLTNGVTDNQDYHFDYDVGKGLGVLTGSGDWAAATSGGQDSLKRPLKGTTSYATIPAFGKARGAATVTATLNGKPVPVDFTQGGTNGWFYAQLVPQSGVNAFQVTAVHPSTQYTNSAINYFTNTITSHTVTNQYDAYGNISRRVWRKASGGLVRQQDYTWDAFQRLVKVVERDSNSSGYDWTAIFDGLGRRIRVSERYVMTNIYSSFTSTTDSYFDPNVEFLEIGVNYNGRAEMKIYGPDVSGVHGGAQGIGGLEAVIDVSHTNKTTVLNDRFGNVLGYAPLGQSAAFKWASARFNSYGPKPGYETPFLSGGVPLVQTLGYQGQRRDLTGLYYWNARPYDSVERRFLTTDPLGTATTPGLYPAFNGDPVNYFDPDGRDSVSVFQAFFPAHASAMGARPFSGSTQGDINWVHGVVYPSIQFAGAPLMEPHVQGAARTMGGAIETGAGAVGVVTTSETGFGLVVSYFAIAHGLDTFQAGWRQMTSGNPTSTLTQQGATWASGSPAIGCLFDQALGFGLTLGASVYAQPARLYDSSVVLTKVGDYYMKEVNAQASPIMQWWGRMSLDAQAQGLAKLGDMAPAFSYENGVMITQDAGQYVSGSFWSTWFEGSLRLRTPFNDIRPRNIGANGIIFDPSKNVIQQTLEGTALGGAIFAGYEAYGVYSLQAPVLTLSKH